MLLREKLKDIDLSLVDLAEFLKVSRPTAYKLIELYEHGEKNKLEMKIKNLFDFIMTTPNVGKTKAISYIMDNLLKPEEQSPKDRKQMIMNLLKKGDNTKVEFIDKLARSEIFDPILDYLLECEKILAKKTLTKEQAQKLEPLRSFYHALGLKLNIKGDKND